jgi:hypothetical protein
MVHLRASIDDSWPLQLSYQRMPFINPGTNRFNVTITVPPKASIDNRTLTVSAYAKAPGLAMDMDTDSCTMVPSGHGCILVEAMGSPCVEGSDGTATVPVRVWNAGSVEARFRVDLVEGSLPLNGWDGPTEVTVPPRNSTEADISVMYDDTDLPLQIRSFRVVVWGGTGMDPDEIEVLVLEEGSLMDRAFGVDLPIHVMLLVIELALVISVIAINRAPSRG